MISIFLFKIFCIEYCKIHWKFGTMSILIWFLWANIQDKRREDKWRLVSQSELIPWKFSKKVNENKIQIYCTKYMSLNPSVLAEY